MKYLPRPLTAALVAAISLALTGGDLLAAKKDKGGDRKGKKEQVQRKGGGSDRGKRVAQSRRASPKPDRRVVTRSSPKPKVSKPSSRDTKRLAVQRSKSRSDSDRKRSDAIVRHRMASASSRDRVAEANRKTIERAQNLAKARERDKARDRARVVKRDIKRDRPEVRRDTSRSRDDARRELERRNIATAARRDNNDRDRNRVVKKETKRIVRDRDHDRDHRSHSHRDRSHYKVRHDHDHHSHDWYHSHGYRYDHDYYRTYRRHRYYNDALGVFLFALSAPPSYVYQTNTYAYDTSYNGYGYEVRVAVQEELARYGYYDGNIDGVVGPGTRSAIYAYQQDYGLEPTGYIDDQLLQSLGLTTY